MYGVGAGRLQSTACGLPSKHDLCLLVAVPTSCVPSIVYAAAQAYTVSFSLGAGPEWHLPFDTLTGSGKTTTLLDGVSKFNEAKMQSCKLVPRLCLGPCRHNRPPPAARLGVRVLGIGASKDSIGCCRAT